MKPNPCIALHYRSKGQALASWPVAVFGSPTLQNSKAGELAKKMYIQEYCEYVCHRLCKEAKAFAFIQRNQLRRVVTCLSLKK